MSKTLADGKTKTISIRCTAELKDETTAFRESHYPDMTESEFLAMCVRVGLRVEGQVQQYREQLMSAGGEKKDC